MSAAAPPALPPEAFAKEDAGDDALFYRSARPAHDIDEAAASRTRTGGVTICVPGRPRASSAARRTWAENPRKDGASSRSHR